MRYVNWDSVVGEFYVGSMWGPVGSLPAWARREGPRECVRRMDEARVVDAGDLCRWRFAADFIESGTSPVWTNGGIAVRCPVTDTWTVTQYPERTAVLEPVVQGVVSEFRLIRDWHTSVLANARADLPAAEFAALPVEARALAMTARRELRRLPHMGFAEAKSASDAWHRWEAYRQRRRRPFGEDCEIGRYLRNGGPMPVRLLEISLAPAVSEGERHPVEGLPEHYWCRLETREAYRQESVRMSHCVGWESQVYAEKYLGKAYPEGIWSLRHGDESLLTAEVAVVVRPNTISALINGLKDAKGLAGTRCPNGFQVRVAQVRAAHNHPVPPKYAAAVRWLEGLRVAPEGMGRSV